MIKSSIVSDYILSKVFSGIKIIEGGYSAFVNVFKLKNNE